MTHNHERVELGELLHQNITDRLPKNPTYRQIGEYVDAAIGAAIQAGYVKPRQVTTVEELDALPTGSVVRSDIGVVYVKDIDLDDPDTPWWGTAGDVSEYQSNRIALPATVLHVGSL